MLRSAKPHVISAFADIAMAIEGDFMHYLEVILRILQQAASVNIDDNADEELVEYINSLRESILGAYTGILQVLCIHFIFKFL